MDSKEFRRLVNKLYESNRKGFGVKVKAADSLKSNLISYSTRYLCAYDSSPILREAHQCLEQLNSLNPATISSAASRARELYMAYARDSIESPLFFDALMISLATNGLFAPNPGMRAEVQRLVSGTLEAMWEMMDAGASLGDGSRMFGMDVAERMMAEMFACAQIMSGIIYC